MFTWLWKLPTKFIRLFWTHAILFSWSFLLSSCWLRKCAKILAAKHFRGSFLWVFYALWIQLNLIKVTAYSIQNVFSDVENCNPIQCAIWEEAVTSKDVVEEQLCEKTSQDGPKSAPYLRLKNSKRLQNVKVLVNWEPFMKKMKKSLTMPKKI